MAQENLNFGAVDQITDHIPCITSFSLPSFCWSFSHYLMGFHFLGMFTKLQRATVSFIMSVCLCLSISRSICMEQLSSHWTDFYEILYLSTF